MTLTERLLPTSGLVCVSVQTNKNFQNNFYDTPAIAEDIAMGLADKGRTVYIAQATFTTKRRLQSNVSLVKNFFLDIDCGEEKPFATQADGLEAGHQVGLGGFHERDDGSVAELRIVVQKDCGVDTESVAADEFILPLFAPDRLGHAAVFVLPLKAKQELVAFWPTEAPSFLPIEFFGRLSCVHYTPCSVRRF